MSIARAVTSTLVGIHQTSYLLQKAELGPICPLCHLPIMPSARYVAVHACKM